MKNGLYSENGELIYYKDDKPKHAGVVEIDGAIYYISSKGRAVKGKHVVHREMANGILKRGMYTFDEDYKLVKGSYIAPKTHRKKGLAGNVQREKAEAKRLLSCMKRVFKNKKNLATLGILAGFTLLLAGVPMLLNLRGNSATTIPLDNVKITLPVFEDDVLLCSNAAKLEYDGQLSLKDVVETGNPYRPFYFEYHLENASGTLLLGEKENLSDARTYELAESEQYVEIHNLKVDTTYYYKVIVDKQEYPGTFHTAKSNRFVYIPGLVNTRDIGGYTNLDGKKVKQGLLIRGVELDGLVNAPYFIPEDELENVQETFGFKFDLDLRGAYTYNGEYTSRLGVAHTFYNSPMYGEIFTKGYIASLQQIFSDMADPEKYPMYLHCTWGQDRTGTIVFLLQGILNLSEEDMRREYLLTSYQYPSLAGSTNMDVIINGLKPYAGDALQEKIVTFLITDIGVTEAEIESIRSIFLED